MAMAGSVAFGWRMEGNGGSRAMILALHVTVSLIGLVSGFVVVAGLLSARRLDAWTAVFLLTTIATSATGFLLPADHLLPSHVVGAISLLVLALALVARYRREMAGRWRWTYVVSAVVALYLNVFVAIVQAFLKIPVLKAAAPTQSEPPFIVTQLAALALFIMVGAFAVIRFRSEALDRRPAVPLAKSTM
jgi:hypothetical protein